MIICSKHEGNGTYREFMLDSSEDGDEVHVKTHLAHRGGDTVVAVDDWTDAGIIKRAPDGLKAAVRAKPGFVDLNKLFTNEIAALQAIAVNYEPTLPN
jgi:hypothetical protein